MTESRNRVEIMVLWREDAGWKVEGIVNFGPKVASFLLMSGSCICYVIGAYMNPNDVPTFYCVKKAV